MAEGRSGPAVSVASVLLLALAVMTAMYALVLAGLVRGLRALKRVTQHLPDVWPSVSVIVPARNEADVLERTLYSLLDQDYPGTWEIVVVDDRSTDNTAAILRELESRHPRLRHVTVEQPNPPSPKKHALAVGIGRSVGEIIVTTDADCTYEIGWLRGMISHMAPDIGVVAGLTVFDLPSNHVPAWQKIQWFDFLVQQLVAAGAAGVGVPSSCNGSNLAYRRVAFDEISGFGESAAVVSGDDVLFAQRVSKQSTWRVTFACAPETVVRSLPVATVREMFDQRMRWASKGLAYRPSMLAFLFGIYAYYLLWIASAAAVILQPGLLPILLGLGAWKLAVDYATVRVGCATFGQTKLLRYFVPFILLHTLFTPVFGLFGLLVPYRWKGEWYRTPVLPRSVRRGLARVRRAYRQRRVAQKAA